MHIKIQATLNRVAAILEKQKAKDKALAELSEKREHAADIKSLQHQLDLEDKRDKVTFDPPSPCILLESFSRRASNGVFPSEVLGPGS